MKSKKDSMLKHPKDDRNTKGEKKCNICGTLTINKFTCFACECKMDNPYYITHSG